MNRLVVERVTADQQVTGQQNSRFTSAQRDIGR